MPTIAFAGILKRHLNLRPERVEGPTVRAALEGVFDGNPRLRSYLLDDQGAVRKHVAVYVNGAPLADRARQSDDVADGDEIYVFQALSGG